MKVEVLPGLAGLDEISCNGPLDRSANPAAFLTRQWHKEACGPTPESLVNVPVLR